ncbi:MAG TPA: preprotein translocase subunit SecY [Candidatus Paceibacterota bacterium]|jgi:preprotein translocase subunit SecY|nr:preprotein translocase subunit SecY [Candidatus Paceibacterota bacterium]HOH11287.1 preprotein translocase subunit SecY [Candidatus Paceibacterota bacterium]HPI24473.1 preprotein translocase subunit SecY [Candidatus Paceibacterota bacterium]HQF40834.1 preprotein translocase subunit SecY [Candidatus Paceibacterota bacterium]HQI25795.1 preprotein translocase subunit SecY [Candidatus Paceibacterota bacterium]
MFATFLNKFNLILSERNLRNRILFVVTALAVFRLGASIPIPGVEVFQLERFLAENQFLGLLNVFSGGGLSTLSIFMLGVGPYITASIIMQLLTFVFPSLKQLFHEEGEAGRRKVAQYSRLLTVPLAVIQGLSLLVLLERQGVLMNLTMFDRVTNIFVVVAGSLLVTWIGELITEFGIGNGVSLLIFAGIVSRFLPTLMQLWLTFDIAQAPMYLVFALIALIIVAAVVFVTEAERPIPVTYAKRVRGMKMYGGMSTYLPIRVNNAGVMPIIFALSILLFPQMIFGFLAGYDNEFISNVASFINSLLNNNWLYAGLYFLLVFAFTYFYSAVTFDPEAISTNLQKNGAFIPGVRPGRSTAEYLSKILTRLTLIGAIFLGFVAVLPILLRSLTGIASLSIGGTSLLIVVSVALEFVKQVDAQVSMREY